MFCHRNQGKVCNTYGTMTGDGGNCNDVRDYAESLYVPIQHVRDTVQYCIRRQLKQTSLVTATGLGGSSRQLQIAN